MMNMKRLGTILLVVSVVLILVTVYLAIFFAPLPQTSVESADQIMSAEVGARLHVAGFVSVVYSRGGNAVLDSPEHVVFSIADFRDYGRFLQANNSNNLDQQWWTVRPIDVDSISGGLRSSTGPSVGYKIIPGANLSVEGIVSSQHIAPNSNVTGFSLDSNSGSDITDWTIK